MISFIKKTYVKGETNTRLSGRFEKEIPKEGLISLRTCNHDRDSDDHERKMKRRSKTSLLLLQLFFFNSNSSIKKRKPNNCAFLHDSSSQNSNDNNSSHQQNCNKNGSNNKDNGIKSIPHPFFPFLRIRDHSSLFVILLLSLYSSTTPTTQPQTGICKHHSKQKEDIHQ